MRKPKTKQVRSKLLAPEQLANVQGGAGSIQSVEGGGATSDVITEKLGPD
jgi:hypothetical protein